MAALMRKMCFWGWAIRSQDTLGPGGADQLLIGGTDVLLIGGTDRFLI